MSEKEKKVFEQDVNKKELDSVSGGDREYCAKVGFNPHVERECSFNMNDPCRRDIAKY